MQILLLASLVFFASSQLGFCESGTREDVSVFREMLQEFQERVFERMDNMEREMEERLAKKADKVFQLFDDWIFTTNSSFVKYLLSLNIDFFQTLKDKSFLNDTAELEQRVEDLEVAMVTVQDDVSELDTDVSLIDGRLLNLETDVSLLTENLINVETDVSDNENAIFSTQF